MSSNLSKTRPRPGRLIRTPHNPKYYQLEETLREQIASWEPDHPIPSELELCKIYSVSKTTVRKALDDLVHEGLLYRVQGVATFVAAPKLRERFAQRTAGFFEDMASRGLDVRTRVLELGVVRPSKHVAAELQLGMGDQVVRLVRLRSIGKQPILISESFVSQRLFPDLGNQDFTNVSLYRLLRDQYNVHLQHGTRLVEVACATEEEARLLHVKPHAPLLVVTGTMYDDTGRPIEHGFARHRGDRSQLELEVLTA